MTKNQGSNTSILLTSVSPLPNLSTRSGCARITGSPIRMQDRRTLDLSLSNFRIAFEMRSSNAHEALKLIGRSIFAILPLPPKETPRSPGMVEVPSFGLAHSRLLVPSEKAPVKHPALRRLLAVAKHASVKQTIRHGFFLPASPRTDCEIH
jgi:hypothetical protein